MSHSCSGSSGCSGGFSGGFGASAPTFSFSGTSSRGLVSRRNRTNSDDVEKATTKPQPVPFEIAISQAITFR